MNEPTLDVLTKRIDRLERENRRLKRVGVVVLVGLAAIGLMGQAAGRTVEAERFVLRDASGKARGAWGVAGGGTALFLLDQDGKHRVELSLGSDGSPSFVLRDKAEKVVWKAP